MLDQAERLQTNIANKGIQREHNKKGYYKSPFNSESGEGGNKNDLKEKKIIFEFVPTVLITTLNINGLNI